ncbi:acyl-CoA N-acyltransferase [Paraphysoderma sedebokerense]|nr:acyl-CoA N-acyltransferase [Paraphysoderma sedebokerense]
MTILDRFTYFHRHNDIYFPIVIEDVASGTVVAAGTLLAEKKFIRNCGVVGHIEDIVVSETMRGKRLGIRIIETLVEIARQQSCYKVILNCNDDNVTFYEKCGFKKKEVEMALYL